MGHFSKEICSAAKIHLKVFEAGSIFSPLHSKTQDELSCKTGDFHILVTVRKIDIIPSSSTV